MLVNHWKKHDLVISLVDIILKYIKNWKNVLFSWNRIVTKRSIVFTRDEIK